MEAAMAGSTYWRALGHLGPSRDGADGGGLDRQLLGGRLTQRAS